MSDKATPELARMMLEQFVPAEHVIAKLRVADKGRLLADLAARAAAATGRPAGELIAPLLAREGLGSTGVGNGIAVPHARIDGLGHLVGFLVRLDRAVEYEAIDGKPVDLVFLLLSPANGNSEHLAALAAVSRRLRDRTVADAIRAAADTERMRALLIGES